MGSIYGEAVDPFAAPCGRPTAGAPEGVQSAPEPAVRGHDGVQTPVTLEPDRDVSVVHEIREPSGRIPDEYRPLFTAKALVALEGPSEDRNTIDRPPSAPTDGSAPTAHVCGLLRSAVAKSGGIPPARLERLAGEWDQVVEALVADGYTHGQVGDLVLYLTRTSRGGKPVVDMRTVAEEAEATVASSGFRSWARSRAVRHWDFPAARRGATVAVSRESLEACLRLRVRVQHNHDVYITPQSPRTVQIDTPWLVAADRMLRLDGVGFAIVIDMIDWATTDDFWRSNVRSMPTLRKHAERFLTDRRFLGWRERATAAADGHVRGLLESFQDYIAHTHHLDVPVAPATWALGAQRLLTRYTEADLHDMMEWAMTSPFFRGRAAALLEDAAVKDDRWTVADQIRQDAGFMQWCRERGRTWAMAVPQVEPVAGRGRAVRVPRISPSAEDHRRVAAGL